jgi:hypothetical protein
MAEAYQRREYGTKTGADGTDKLESTGRLEMLRAGGTVGDQSGPTGSSRSYPKGSSLSLTPDFNPMKAGKPTYGTEGV